MRKGLILLLCALMLGMSSSAAWAQDTSMDPAEVVEAMYAAVEEGDLEYAGSMLAETVVLVILPPPPGTNGAFVGKEAVLDWYESLYQNNLKLELSDVHVSGNTFTASNLTWVDDLPIAPIELDGAGIVQGGLVQSLSWVMTPETVQKLDAVMMLSVNEALAHQFMDVMWNEGDMDVGEQIIADDFIDYNPRPGMDSDKAGIMADATAFHEGGRQTRIDDLVVTEDQVIIRATVMAPGDGGTMQEDMQAIIVLGVKDGQIASRRVAIFGW